jgi:O-antigen ligase/Tfp pilus assembly protein PilF
MSLRDFLRFTVIIAMFATPFICLIVLDNMFFPFITGKNFTFRILTEIMLGAWLLLMFIDRAYRPKFSYILAAAGAFLVAITIADFQGVNPYKSFWSNYERMEGLITHIHLFLYFIVSGSVLLTDSIWYWFWNTSLGVSVIAALNGFAQLSGKEEIHQSSTRLDATFGNSAYLAVYTLFNIFLSAFLYLRTNKKTNLRFIYPIVALINLIILYYTQTRGTLLGLIGGSIVALFLVALFGKETPKVRKYCAYAIATLVLLVGAFIAFKHTAFIQQSPTLARMASISLDDSTTKSRFMIWQMSWEGFKERPIFGWGQENFLYVFAKHYNPKMWNQEPWFDRSHDVFFDWLVAGGAVGLLTYLSMFAALIYTLWWKRKHHFSVLERAVLTGMLAGYFIHNVFVFDNLTSYIVFFGLMGYLHALSAEGGEDEKKAEKKKRGEDLESGDVAVAALVVLVLTSSLVYFVNIRNWSANEDLINAIRPDGVLVDDGHGNKKIALEEVIERGLFGSGEAREQLAQFAVQTLDPRIPEAIRKQFFEATAREFDQELKNDPENVRTQSFAATFYARFGQYDQALQHFQEAIKLSPNRQTNYIDLAMMYVSMGRYDDAYQVAKKGYELEPANADAGVAYATALIYAKRIADTGPVLEKLGSSAFDSRIVNAMGNSGYYEQLIALENEKIARGLATGRDYFSLAGGYASIGDKQKAFQAIDTAVSVDPSLKDDAEKLKTQIDAGRPVTKSR